jgi:transposase
MNEFSIGSESRDCVIPHMEQMQGPDENIPEHWTRTLRPCGNHTECGAQTTYIDENKVWHCLKCGWRSDDMKKHKTYTEAEIKEIKKLYADGLPAKDIALKLNRSASAISVKLCELRKKGEIDKKQAPQPAVEPEKPEVEEVAQEPDTQEEQTITENDEKAPQDVFTVEVDEHTAESEEETARLTHDMYVTAFEAMLKRLRTGEIGIRRMVFDEDDGVFLVEYV